MNLNNRRGLLFILVGLVAAIAAGIVVFALAMNLTKGATTDTAITPPQNTPVPSAVVLVAAQDIEPSTLITTSMILTATYPADLVPSDAFTNTAQVVGLAAQQRIPSGLPMLKREFLDTGGRQGIVGVVIPKGKVLAAFPSTDILNSTGAVQKGDHVDILLTLPISGTARLDNAAGTGSQVQENAKSIVAQETLQNIEVYSTGFWTPPNTAANQNQNQNNQQGLKIVTFIVDHQEALILKYIKDSGGTIDLVVRSLEDNAQAPTDPVNIDYIVDLYKFIGLPKPTP